MSGQSDPARPLWATRSSPETLLARLDAEAHDLDGIRLARALHDLAQWAAFAPQPEVRQLSGILAAWLDDGAAVPLDRWIGVRSAGRGSMRQAIMIATRDAALRALARSRYADLSPAAAARVLAAAWRRWAETKRQREQRSEPLHDPDRTWWHLAQAGIRPVGAETIRLALRDQAS